MGEVTVRVWMSQECVLPGSTPSDPPGDIT